MVQQTSDSKEGDKPWFNKHQIQNKTRTLVQQTSDSKQEENHGPTNVRFKARREPWFNMRQIS